MSKVVREPHYPAICSGFCINKTEKKTSDDEQLSDLIKWCEKYALQAVLVTKFGENKCLQLLLMLQSVQFVFWQID